MWWFQTPTPVLDFIINTKEWFSNNQWYFCSKCFKMSYNLFWVKFTNTSTEDPKFCSTIEYYNRTIIHIMFKVNPFKRETDDILFCCIDQSVYILDFQIEKMCLSLHKLWRHPALNSELNVSFGMSLMSSLFAIKFYESLPLLWIWTRKINCYQRLNCRSIYNVIPYYQMFLLCFAQVAQKRFQRTMLMRIK